MFRLAEQNRSRTLRCFMRKGFLIGGGLPRACGDARTSECQKRSSSLPFVNAEPTLTGIDSRDYASHLGIPLGGDSGPRAHQKIAEVGGRLSSSASERVRQVISGPAPVGDSP